jgi:hypothetical protein
VCLRPSGGEPRRLPALRSLVQLGMPPRSSHCVDLASSTASAGPYARDQRQRWKGKPTPLHAVACGWASAGLSLKEHAGAAHLLLWRWRSEMVAMAADCCHPISFATASSVSPLSRWHHQLSVAAAGEEWVCSRRTGRSLCQWGDRHGGCCCCCCCLRALRGGVPRGQRGEATWPPALTPPVKRGARVGGRVAELESIPPARAVICGTAARAHVGSWQFDCLGSRWRAQGGTP